MTKWASDKLDYIKSKFGGDYCIWLDIWYAEGHATHNRQGLFCSLYAQLLEAIKAIQHVDNMFIHDAMDEKIKYDIFAMELMQGHFKKKEA